MTVKFQGNNVTLIGKELKVGDKLDNFVVVDNSLNEVSLDSLKGKKVFLTVPSLDTPVCDLEVKTFNKRASEIKDLAGIYTISLDLPFAQSRWCGQNGIEKVKTFSDYKYHEFAKATSTYIKELGLLTRAIFIVDENNTLVFVKYLEEITNEPNYDEILDKLK